MGNCSYEVGEQFGNLLLGQPYEIVRPWYRVGAHLGRFHTLTPR
jgi:hypothetical protein